MIEFFRISLAQINIEIICNRRTVFYQCEGYLTSFTDPDVVISASVPEMEEEASRLPAITEFYEGVATTRYYGEIESTIVQRKIAEAMLAFDTFLMHGSVVALDNQAYMFTAPSGVGKTTRIRLWLHLYPDSIVVNGDKPLIKITDTQVIACGTPWCGKEGWNTNTMIPLKAIFLLERADEGEESSIKEVSLGKAFPFLLQQIYRPDDLCMMRKTLQLLKSLEGKVKIYNFRSTPTAESVQLAYETANLTISTEGCKRKSNS